MPDRFRGVCLWTLHLYCIPLKNNNHTGLKQQKGENNDRTYFFLVVHYSSTVSILSFVLLSYFFMLMPENTEPMPSDVL